MSAADHPRAPGRLEIRRASIHDRLALAAAQLFVEQGYESTTVEQIASRADVALRTFYRYCSSKADAVGPSIERNLQRILDELHAVEPGTGLRAAVLDAMNHAVGDNDFGRYLATTLLTIPELMPRWLEVAHRLQDGLVAELPRRFVLSEGLETEMVAAVVTAAVSTAVQRAVLLGSSIDPVLRDALVYVPDVEARRIDGP